MLVDTSFTYSWIKKSTLEGLGVKSEWGKLEECSMDYSCLSAECAIMTLIRNFREAIISG